MKEIIKFEEFLDVDFEWKKSYSYSSAWDNVGVDDDYEDYIIYWCSKKDGVKTLYRNKKKKVCEHCGSKLE